MWSHVLYFCTTEVKDIEEFKKFLDYFKQWIKLSIDERQLRYGGLEYIIEGEDELFPLMELSIIFRDKEIYNLFLISFMHRTDYRKFLDRDVNWL